MLLLCLVNKVEYIVVWSVHIDHSDMGDIYGMSDTYSSSYAMWMILYVCVCEREVV